jgi:hypothetical protein
MQQRLIGVITLIGLLAWFLGHITSGGQYPLWNAIWKGLAIGWVAVLFIMYVRKRNKL